jgi:transcriptional regulator with XRE-family HTH domain
MDPVEDMWQQHLRNLGGYIRAQREFNQLSQRQLANLTDLSDTYMSQLERGLHEPSIRVLRALAQGLGVDPDELIRRAAGLHDDASAPTTEQAILADPRLTDAQKQALLVVVDGFLTAER